MIEENYALEKNSLLHSAFPIMIKYTENTISTLDIAPLSIIEISNILSISKKDFFLVFDMGQCYCFHSDSGKPLTLNEIAFDNNVEFHSYDDDNICVAVNQLDKLFNDFDHYEITLLQSNSILDEISFIEVIDKVQQMRNKDEIILKYIESELILHSHDDCYLHIEARNRDKLFLIIFRMLENLIRLHFIEKIEKIEMEYQEIEILVRNNDDLTILTDAIVKNNVIVWPIYDQVYPLENIGNLKGLDAFREPWKYLKASYSTNVVKVTISDFL